jgi:hypothetical protein
MNERVSSSPDWDPPLPTPSSTPERAKHAGPQTTTTLLPQHQEKAVPLASAPRPASPARPAPTQTTMPPAMPGGITPPLASPDDADRYVDYDTLMVPALPAPEGARQPKRPLLTWPSRPPTTRPRRAAGSDYCRFELNLALQTGQALRERLIALEARLDANLRACAACPPRGSAGRLILRQQRILTHMTVKLDAILEWRIRMVATCLSWRHAHPDCPRRGL